LNIIAVILIEVILLFIAMMCRSLVHTLLHHYGEFDKKFNADDYWFFPDESWTNKKTIKWTVKIFNWFTFKFNIPVQFSDAFHFFNTVELGAYDLAITVPLTIALGLVWWWGIIIFLIIGLVLMVLFFDLGYDEIWR
jgi:hypothetical protein